VNVSHVGLPLGGSGALFDGMWIGLPIGRPGRGNWGEYVPGKLGGRVANGILLNAGGFLFTCNAWA
jgi:hypothetical protein